MKEKWLRYQKETQLLSLANKSPSRLPVIVQNARVTSPSQLRSCLPALPNPSFLLHLHRVSLLLLPTGHSTNTQPALRELEDAYTHARRPSSHAHTSLTEGIRNSWTQLKQNVLKLWRFSPGTCWSEEDKGRKGDGPGDDLTSSLSISHLCVAFY